MKKLLQLLFLLMACVVNAQEVVVGEGTDTGVFPLGNYFGFERSAALYTSTEMGVTGNLLSISWYADLTGEGVRF